MSREEREKEKKKEKKGKKEGRKGEKERRKKGRGRERKEGRKGEGKNEGRGGEEKGKEGKEEEEEERGQEGKGGGREVAAHRRSSEAFTSICLVGVLGLSPIEHTTRYGQRKASVVSTKRGKPTQKQKTKHNPPRNRPDTTEGNMGPRK